ncbi:MAG: phenylacetate--CoA ligase family protein, partial [Flavobacteriales bacterium]|nr:phenylacetate--CoA ligase family protein [Flavobacteriales bacterium]MDW8431275.1 phenylacetate--CoA ligase family protein [Flavobacteriales bacterium]
QTAFTECPAGQGLHAQDELVFSEVLDEDGNPVPDGAEGQLVFTHLGVEGMPLLRYATGDMVRVWRSPCSCGLTSLRIGPVRGRKERRLKFNGTTVYPEQYVAAMAEAGYLGNFQIRLTRQKENHDHLTLVLPLRPIESLSDEKVVLIFRERALPVPDIIRIPEDELKQALFPESQRKPVNILDQRI